MNFCLAAIDNLEMSRGLGTLCKNDDRECSRSDATPTRRGLCPLVYRVTDSEKVNINLRAPEEIATRSLSIRAFASARGILILEN